MCVDDGVEPLSSRQPYLNTQLLERGTNTLSHHGEDSSLCVCHRSKRRSGDARSLCVSVVLKLHGDKCLSERFSIPGMNSRSVG